MRWLLNLFRRKPKPVPLSHEGQWYPVFYKVMAAHMAVTTVRR